MGNDGGSACAVAASIFVISLPCAAPLFEFETTSFSVHKLSPKHERKPVDAGRIVVPEWDIDIPGKFQPLVTQAVSDEVQLILDGGAAALTPRVRCHEKSRQLSRNSVCSRFHF